MTSGLLRLSQYSTIAANTVFLVVAVAIGLAWFQRNEGSDSRRTSERAPLPVTQLDGWQQFTGVGAVIANPSGKVTLVEFADFQCPACGYFSRDRMSALYQRYGDSLRVEFRHMPLPQNQFAIAAATAAECAGEQGRFREMHDELFASQAMIGITPFGDFAARAGVPDLVAFDRCSKGPVHPAIARDAEVTQSLGMQGTPTLLVHGSMVFGVPDTTQLFQLVDMAFGTQ